MWGLSTNHHHIFITVFIIIIIIISFIIHHSFITIIIILYLFFYLLFYIFCRLPSFHSSSLLLLLLFFFSNKINNNDIIIIINSNGECWKKDVLLRARGGLKPQTLLAHKYSPRYRPIKPPTRICQKVESFRKRRYLKIMRRRGQQHFKRYRPQRG